MRKTEFDIEIVSWQLIKDVPSASGMVKFNEDFYIIGDDSPYMFHLDKDFELLSKSLIHSPEKLRGTKIPKIDKPDFEAMEMISETEILVFGSGSKSPERDVCVFINIENEVSFEEFDISKFYSYIRNMEIMDGFELNIEGMTFKDGFLYLFNRGRNIIFSFSLNKFVEHCKTGVAFPIPKADLLILPKINGLQAGFSGATTFKEKPYFIFTAAVEDTPNAYDDGEIVGSFIGLIEIQKGKIGSDFLIKQIPNPGFPLKVESVIIDKVKSKTQTDLILVTDNDGNPSEVIKLRMTFK